MIVVVFIQNRWPWLLTAAAVALWWLCGSPFPESPDALFGAAATVASVFASFLGVSKAIILTIKGTEIFKILEKHEYTKPLFGFLRTGIFSAVLFAALSIVGFFIDHTTVIDGHNVWKVFSYIWIASGALALFTYMRISNILFKILKQA